MSRLAALGLRVPSLSLMNVEGRSGAHGRRHDIGHLTLTGGGAATGRLNVELFTDLADSWLRRRTTYTRHSI